MWQKARYSAQASQQGITQRRKQPMRQVLFWDSYELSAVAICTRNCQNHHMLQAPSHTHFSTTSDTYRTAHSHSKFHFTNPGVHEANFCARSRRPLLYAQRRRAASNSVEKLSKSINRTRQPTIKLSERPTASCAARARRVLASAVSHTQR